MNMSMVLTFSSKPPSKSKTFLKCWMITFNGAMYIIHIFKNYIIANICIWINMSSSACCSMIVNSTCPSNCSNKSHYYWGTDIFFSKQKQAWSRYCSLAFISVNGSWFFRETKRKVSAVSHTLSEGFQAKAGAKRKTIFATWKEDSWSDLAQRAVRYTACSPMTERRWCACDWPAEVEGTFIWIRLIDMLGSMTEEKASLQSLPIQSRSPGPPQTGACLPISHNHSTELKETSPPYALTHSSHHLNTYTDGKTHTCTQVRDRH